MLRSAHLDLEGLVLDREVRALRDQFVTFNYSKILYNGLYFSPEREFLEESIKASQKNVNGQVRCRAYKGQMMVLGRSSETEKLYDATESSMDEITGFEPSETSGEHAVLGSEVWMLIIYRIHWCPGHPAKEVRGHEGGEGGTTVKCAIVIFFSRK